MRQLLLRIVGILISFPVMKLFHQPGGGIAQPQRHRLRPSLLYIRLAFLTGTVQSVGFWRKGKISHSMDQIHITLRHPVEMACLVSRHRHLQRLAVRNSHIFAGETDQAARNIQRILSALQHPHQPVDRGIGIAVPHGFVECRDEIIVLFPIFIIQKGLSGNALLHHRVGDPDFFRGDLTVHHRHLQGVERRSGVSVGKSRDRSQLLSGDPDSLVSVSSGI